MDESIDRNRRRFLGSAAMTMAAAQLGILGMSTSSEGASRQLEAISRAKHWLNSPPLSTATLSDRVVLVQFGTYTCINWLRTLPYIRAWVQKYRQRLLVIGVHTPEFTFEKDRENVRRALQQLGIDYPIAIDNDYAIWRAFSNQQSILAGAVLPGCARTPASASGRRGRVRPIGNGHPALAC